MKYNIANKIVEFTGNRASDVTNMRRFEPFLSNHSDSQILIEVKGEYDDFIESSLIYFLSYEDTEFSCYKLDNNSFSFKLFNTKEHTKFSINHTLETNTAVIGGDGDIDMLTFATWVAYGIIVLKYGLVPVHTSAIEYKGKGVIFLGESGTGKSTHTRLWRENIEGARLLNDDSPIVQVEDEKIYIYGSPWSGKTPCYRQEKVELSAIVRLSQAPYNKIRPLKIIESFAALFPSCPPAFANDSALSEGVCNFISKVLSQVSVFHLECLPDKDAALLSFNTAINEKLSK